MLTFHLLDPADVPWQHLDSCSDRTVFQTREWLDFIAETQNAQPVIAELRDGSEVAGYFSGCVFRRFGVRILGSSFPGWTTPYVGFNLCPGVPRRAALQALEDFAFGPLKCLHMEVSDRYFAAEDAAGLGFSPRFYDSYETDLSQPEEEIFNKMNSACRRCIRKAEKSGVRIEEASDSAFAVEYCAQLEEVFAKQGLVPTYDLGRVRALIKHLLPTGRLLLLRARDPSGNCIGTGIYPAYNQIAEFWGNASFRSGQIFRPNESIHWYAMRYWKQRGIRLFDWGGGGTYKEKYGPYPIAVPWFYKSRFKVLATMRSGAEKMMRQKQRILGRLRKTEKKQEGGED